MIFKFKQGNRFVYDFSKWVVDDVSDISKIPACPMGSTVYVIHTKETYMIDSNKVWYPTSSDAPPVECDCVEEMTIWQDLGDKT